MTTENEFSSVSQDSESVQVLTEELYPECIESDEVSEYSERKKNDSEDFLKKHIDQFNEKKMEYFKSHDEQNRDIIRDHSLYFLENWNTTIPTPCSTSWLSYLSDEAAFTDGGFFIKWNGKGLLVNPSEEIFDQLDFHGITLEDIDFILQTCEDPKGYQTIRKIHSTNNYLNKNKQDHHKIHYYLLSEGYQSISRELKPQYKHEQQLIHCLDFYLDSPTEESITLSNGIVIKYFPLTSPTYDLEKQIALGSLQGSLGIRLDLTSVNPNSKSYRIAHIPNTPWTPLLSDSIGQCDLLIASFGYTHHLDYEKVTYNHDCLGYYGCLTLLEELRPKIMILSEFCRKNGDLRLEIVKKMREEFLQQDKEQKTAIFPSDQKLVINLLNFKIRCTLTDQDTDIKETQMIKKSLSFGPLEFLSPSCYL